MNKGENKITAAQIHWKVVEENTLHIQLSGNWKVSHTVPRLKELFSFIDETKSLSAITFDASELKDWDSSLLTFLLRLCPFAEKHGVTVVQKNLPSGVCKLINLVQSAPTARPPQRQQGSLPFLSRVGQQAIGFYKSFKAMMQFLGEIVLAFAALLRSKAQFQVKDLFLIIQESGAQALPIVSLISILVGLILAFVGSVQLRMFGAEIYVANLVGLGMTMEMGAMMTAVIMVGRSGASFAAQLGTMQINEEIDAFKTLGISPVEFLVLPRVIALVLMMPLLCLYADFVGITGGMLVSVFLLDISPEQYVEQISKAVKMNAFAMGLIKSVVFGVLIAFFGCFRGMQCGRSSSAVGEATTAAVVSGIVAIVVADAILTIIFYVTGF